MKIKKTDIKSEDLIHQFLPASYTEMFETTVVSTNDATPDDILVDFWTEMPGWINFLFKLRHWIVKPFGLRGEDDSTRSKEKLIACIRHCEPNDLMNVAAKSENETVLRLTDKHLTAYLSVALKKLANGSTNVRVATVVQFHNTLGKVYFCVISPFHFIIVISKMKNTLKKLLLPKPTN